MEEKIQKFEAILNINRSSINRAITVVKLLDRMPYLWDNRLVIITDDREFYDSVGDAESYVFSDAGEGAEIKYTAEELIIYIKPIEGEGDV